MSLPWPSQWTQGALFVLAPPRCLVDFMLGLEHGGLGATQSMHDIVFRMRIVRAIELGTLHISSLVTRSSSALHTRVRGAPGCRTAQGQHIAL